MTHDGLIAKARERIKAFERMDSCHVRLAKFSDVRARDVVVYFRRTDWDDEFKVCLDRETGECVEVTYRLPIPPSNSEQRGMTSDSFMEFNHALQRN